MTALAGALVFFVLHLGPNQGLIYDQLARRDAADRRLLAIEALYEISREPLYLVFHHEKQWRRAFYLPAGQPALPGPRSLPGLAVPRLYLYRPHYLGDGGRLKDFGGLAVDTASVYFDALLGRRFEIQLRRPDFAARANARAELLYPEVPAGERLEVYGATLAEFGGHLLSIANELARAKRRGVGICPQDKPLPLLEHWRRAFEGGQFPGTYTPPGTFEPALTQRLLEPEDKRLAAAELLGHPRWKGEALADLGVCLP